MSRPYLIFCTDFHVSDEYHHFCHEADVLLGTLGNAVREQRITVTDARRIWEPYKAFWPAMYDEDDEYFPDIEESGMDFMPATEPFVDAACAADVPGVGIPRYITPMAGVILEITDQVALDALQEKLGDRYRIVVRDDGDYMFPATVDAALALIAAARQTAANESSTTELKAPEDDVRLSTEGLNALADGIAREMLDNLNTYAGQHEVEQKPPTTKQTENDNQKSRGTLRERTEKLAQEMVDNINKHAGEHEDGRWNSAPSSR